ncbi:MAG: hypothetical protein ACI35R_16105 [Bacillus sp. (in: firmicutes)]
MKKVQLAGVALSTMLALTACGNDEKAATEEKPKEEAAKETEKPENIAAKEPAEEEKATEDTTEPE